jgi:protocatechuate 3,4-dioxygenase beta subunit
MRRPWRSWALGLTGLVLLAGCSSAPAATPAGSGQGPTVVMPTAAPVPTTGPSATAVASAGATSENKSAATIGAIVTALPSASPEPTTAPEALDPPASAIVCTPGELTPAQTEGPYYMANPPKTTSLLQPGMVGTKLTVSGYVLDASCQPVPGARVDFWQADSEGRYDNQGYTLRGFQVTDSQGRYSVETVVPGLYPGRTSHIHLKVTAPGGPTLTTQLYLPDEAANASDRIYNPRTLLTIEKSETGEMGRYDFVINTT